MHVESRGVKGKLPYLNALQNGRDTLYELALCLQVPVHTTFVYSHRRNQLLSAGSLRKATVSSKVDWQLGHLLMCSASRGKHLSASSFPSATIASAYAPIYS